MLRILRNRTYARLFLAQVVALLGTGLLTVALGLLAYAIAGERAGAVLGTALAIKMVAYVALAPISQAAAARLPRKAVLVGADLVRAAVAMCLPFVDEVWQVYALIFVLQAASATFTPAFQATIPDILPREEDYTRALSLSRLAYDLENLASPALAGFLLTVMTYHYLFTGTVAGFLGSAALVLASSIPTPTGSRTRPFLQRLTRGSWIYLATPRLRGLLALNMTAAAAGAFVIVNTVVIVRSGFGLPEAAVSQALAAFGGGSMIAALLLPRLLDRLKDRSVMANAALLLSVVTLGHAGWLMAAGLPGWGAFLLLWGISGLCYSAILTPTGRLLRVSAHAEDRPALFSAQFALSHACWLLTYPLAGWAGEAVGLPAAMAILGALALAGAVAARALWPAAEDAELPHDHPDLPDDHPHLLAHRTPGGGHAHSFMIDDDHPAWPRSA
ncbi:MFS transporter [Ostreiculturibacter nitratireducens]|uniref:MFS transporter n=1 Tax=Ostreiculturibacter nitratireducens TaxID=3075226 RepID=UPI0031B5E9B4